jgi:hypothetical protein
MMTLAFEKYIGFFTKQKSIGFESSLNLNQNLSILLSLSHFKIKTKSLTSFEVQHGTKTKVHTLIVTNVRNFNFQFQKFITFISL